MTKSYAALPEMNMAFTGAKLAILRGDAVVSILRDDKAEIPYPNHWDLPGGGREAGETALHCVLRETREELGLRLGPQDICWGKFYGSGISRTWFFVSRSAAELGDDIRLGDEGQTWCWMKIGTFLQHPRVVPHFQDRLRAYLNEGALH